MIGQLKALLPKSVKRTLREVAYAGIVTDFESYRTYLSLSRERPGQGQQHQRRSIRVRPLGGREVSLRRGTTDATTVFTTFFHRFHRPPKAAVMRPQPFILDLGANIGLTMADFATTFPGSTVVGVELDHENAMLCRQNIAPWSTQCTLIEGAVWTDDGEITYESSFGSEDAFTVAPSEKSTRGTPIKARSLNISTILREAGDPPLVDFVKMDIEGAESSVLEKNTEWAERVRAIGVELHHGYTHEAAMSALRRMGFIAARATDHIDSVYGVRAP